MIVTVESISDNPHPASTELDNDLQSDRPNSTLGGSRITSRMNTGHDPMLSSFDSEGWLKLLGSRSEAPSPMGMLTCTSNPFSLSVEGLLSPEQSSSFTDFWSNDRKRATSVKEEEDDFSSVGGPEEEKVANEDIEIDDVDIEDSAETRVKTEIHDPGYGDVVPEKLSRLGKRTHSMTEADARRLVDEEFHKIAFIPDPELSQKEKIEYILSKSDCKEFKVNDILQFDKRCKDSAKACAKIVQDIPQRYRWDCVEPEDIPCCYTIVADCKKLSSRDKPPRPMNAFMIWAQGARRLINELCPKMQNAIISEALGDCWRNKSDAFKRKFEDEKNKLRQFHNVEFPEYKYKPKTKVQKAKEKEEMSQNKAKMRALVKREKTKASTESGQSKRKPHGNVGRPKKVQAPKAIANTQTPKQAVPQSRPDVRDMLNMKLLNDRRTKDLKGRLCQTRYGQLSPIEADSPGTSDVYDDVCHADSCHELDTSEPHTKVTPSSVFDTPANTPPFNESHEPHQSPATQTTPPSPLTVMSPTIPTASYAPTSQATINFMMPSLSAILSSPVKSGTTFVPITTSSIPVSIPVTIPVSVISIQPSASSSNRTHNPLGDFYLVYGNDSKPVSFKPPRCTNSARLGSPHILGGPESDSTESDCNNNQASVTNNNNINNNNINNNLPHSTNYSVAPPPTYNIGLMESMLVNAAKEPSDLDSLYDLDIPSPLLSEDQLNLLLSDVNF